MSEDLIDAGRVPSPGQLLLIQADFAAAVDRRMFQSAAPAKRFSTCREDCTTDCGHCKGAGRPAPMLPYRPGRRTHHVASADLVPPSARRTTTGEFHDPETGVYYVVSGAAGLIEVSVPAQARKVVGVVSLPALAAPESELYAACWCDDGRHSFADRGPWHGAQADAERHAARYPYPEPHITQAQITEVIA